MLRRSSRNRLTALSGRRIYQALRYLQCADDRLFPLRCRNARHRLGLRRAPTDTYICANQASDRSIKSPNDNLDERPGIQHVPLVNQQVGFHVVILDNTSSVVNYTNIGATLRLRRFPPSTLLCDTFKATPDPALLSLMNPSDHDLQPRGSFSPAIWRIAWSRRAAARFS